MPTVLLFPPAIEWVSRWSVIPSRSVQVQEDYCIIMCTIVLATNFKYFQSRTNSCSNAMQCNIIQCNNILTHCIPILTTKLSRTHTHHALTCTVSYTTFHCIAWQARPPRVSRRTPEEGHPGRTVGNHTGRWFENQWSEECIYSSAQILYEWCISEVYRETMIWCDMTWLWMIIIVIMIG